MSRREDWMTEAQWEAAQFVAAVYRGFHHVHGKFKPAGRGIEVNVFAGISTYDFDILTRAVVMAHDKCMRLEVASSGPNKLKLYVHKRQREGSMFERHPTLEDAAASIRAEDTSHG